MSLCQEQARLSSEKSTLGETAGSLANISEG